MDYKMILQAEIDRLIRLNNKIETESKTSEELGQIYKNDEVLILLLHERYGFPN